MIKKNFPSFLVVTLIILMILPNIAIISTANLCFKKTIKVAIIRQHWDIIDQSFFSRFSTLVHRHRLNKAERKFDVKIEVFEFWDDWLGGDINDGMLKKLDIDVIVAPGGVGGWYSPQKYRRIIKEFVWNGGGFYGICGDATFGSLGVQNLKNRYLNLMKRMLGFEEFSPMLGLANVYTDATVFNRVLGNPVFFTKISMYRLLSQLPLSRAPIYFEKNKINIQEPYIGKSLQVMMGSAPLVDGPFVYRLFMPKVYTIATYRGYDKPYDRSIRGEKAIIATTYGKGRVILSPVHTELTIGNLWVNDVYMRNVLWLGNCLDKA
jgi:hypothetical protein